MEECLGVRSVYMGLKSINGAQSSLDDNVLIMLGVPSMTCSRFEMLLSMYGAAETEIRPVCNNRGYARPDVTCLDEPDSSAESRYEQETSHLWVTVEDISH
jgi:hypothetical protein